MTCLRCASRSTGPLPAPAWKVSALEDLVLAFSEAASNVLEHAHGRGSVTVWHSATDVVVEVTDHLGRLTPGHRHRPRSPLHARSGYGLWLMG
ncbi:ATP-binding protein [Nonomuraea dietziae]|uniref:ATP-binding protein n=1 Tax=Nonomuraea dietziae TaxID=65515 RepID=UPI0034020AAB